MSNQTDSCSELVKSNINQVEPSLAIINEDQSKEQCSNNSLLEQSFEIIAPSEVLNVKMEYEQNMSPRNSSKQSEDATRSESVVQDNSIQRKPKKSTSFLSRLQSSSDSNENSNIPSSIASAFSSFSSFTSNLHLNTSLAGNTSTNSLTIETASVSTKLCQITETREDIFYKKACLERKNLINLTKLIVRDLISSSLSVGRTIDDCQNAVHLTNYFTLIDRVLKHGLKQNLLSGRSVGLWNVLETLPKYLKESTLISESIRSLTNTKTADGKIKAWMRLAMMQKKLPEYFSELLAQKNTLLTDIYHDYAFMLNEEAHVFAGLIIGVNVIDCNFFVKDDNFDLMDDIIELRPYLRVANNLEDDQDDAAKPDIGFENMTAILDQKNYLEEWNKRLESTVSELQMKIKNLEEQNSKLEMEAKLSEAKMAKLEGSSSETTSEKQSLPTGSVITEAFKKLMNNVDSVPRLPQSISISNSLNKPEVDVAFQEENSTYQASDQSVKDDVQTCEVVASEQLIDVGEDKNEHPQAGRSVATETEAQDPSNEYEKELNRLRERTSILEASYRSALDRIKILERELDIQTSMNADKETTIQIYEKDIREKQSQVETLRQSLVDAKKVNSDLTEKLNDTSTKLKERIKTLSNLQASLDKWKLENKTLATRLQDKQTDFKSITSELEKATSTIEDLRKFNDKVKEELRKERESGHSSSVTLETQNIKINELKNKLVRLETEYENARPYKEQFEELERRCRDYELSLEEIGSQLRESRLEVENLKENSAVFLDSQWMDSKQIKSCALCQQSFSVTRRKHHCRLCGNVFCQTCSDNKMEMASSAKPVRVCDTCHSFLLAKFVKASSAS